MVGGTLLPRPCCSFKANKQHGVEDGKSYMDPCNQQRHGWGKAILCAELLPPRKHLEQSPGLLLWVFLSSVKPRFVQADSGTLLAA